MTRSLAGFFVVFVAVPIGCFVESGSDSDSGGQSGCEPGRLGCPCVANETCDAPLSCEAGQCVVAGASESGGQATTTGTAEPGTTHEASDESGQLDTSTGTPDSGAVTLYLGFTPATGDLREGDEVTPLRTQLDERCLDAAAVFAPTGGCSEATAVISLSSQDTIASLDSYGLPLTAPVQGPGGAAIAASFQTMISTSSLDATLEAAGATEGFSAQRWWSGSTTSGGFDAEVSCSGFTSDAPAVNGRTGLTYVTTSNWISENTQFGCVAAHPVLCACW